MNKTGKMNITSGTILDGNLLRPLLGTLPALDPRLF